MATSPDSVTYTTTPFGVLGVNQIPTGAGIISTPPAVSNGYNTVVGIQAGTNLNPSAIEATIVGYGAGGAGLRGGAPAGVTGMTGAENTLIGWFSGTQMTTASFMTAVGVNTMGAEVDGSNSVAVGADAMRNSTGITSSIAIGTNALRNGAATTTSIAIGSNTLIGAETTPSTSVGSDLIAIGFTAIASASRTTLSNTVAIGTRAGNALQTGTAGVFIGTDAGKVQTASGNSIGIGFAALIAATTVTDTVAIGRAAGAAAVSSFNNTFVGHSSGTGTTGNNNVAVGSHALEAVGAAVNSVAVGHNAGNKYTGNAALILGPQVASTTLTTGTNVILIGTNNACDTPASGTPNYMAIASGATAIMTATATTTTPVVEFPGASIAIGASGPNIKAGTGAATGTQPAGSLWLRTDGAAGTRIYVSQGAGSWLAIAGV